MNTKQRLVILITALLCLTVILVTLAYVNQNSTPDAGPSSAGSNLITITDPATGSTITYNPAVRNCYFYNGSLNCVARK